MDNYEFLDKLGYKIDTESDLTANKSANSLLDTQSNEPFSVKVGNNLIQISPNNFSMAYMQNVWSELSLVKMLRVLFWTKTAFCKKYNIPNTPFLFFDSRIKTNTYSPACAFGDQIFINFEEFFLNSTGYDCFEFLLHECMHLLQVKHYRVIPDSLKDFIPPYNKNDKMADVILEANILKLFLDGKNFNFRTNQYEYLSQMGKRDLVFLKNMLIVISPTGKNVFCNKSKVKSYKDFENYINNLMYYTSPFEYEAYITSKNMTDALLRKNSKKYPELVGDDDIETLDILRVTKARVESRRHALQKYFNMNADQIFDMQMHYMQYNKWFRNSAFLDESVKKHKEKFDKVYKARFQRNFTSGLKEFLNNDSKITIDNDKQLK